MTRLALVGYGRIAPKHIAAVRGLDAEIVAACNRSEAGQQRAKTEGGIPATYSSIAEMLEKERPDGVICCASADQIFTAAEAIIPSGVPTLLEKPPGTSVEELVALQSMAEQSKTPVMVALNRRHYSVLQKALDDAGGFEAVTDVAIEWSDNPRYLVEERGFSLEQAAKAVFSHSLHGIDLLTYLAGDIAEPAVFARNFGDPCRWLMSASGISERGVLATFHSTWDSPGRWRVSFCTPGRRYTFAPIESCEVTSFSDSQARQIEPDACDSEFKPGFYRQGETFLKVIQTRAVPEAFNLASVMPAMRLAEALTDACKQAGH